MDDLNLDIPHNVIINEIKDSYLGTHTMRATSSSMALAGTVLGFDIIELWYEALDGHLKCIYVYASESLMSEYPDLIYGHYPNQKKEHKLSPSLCLFAKESPNRCHWRIAKDDEIHSTHHSALNPELPAPMLTEMSYQLEGDFGGQNVFIVGFALNKIKFKASKLKFLNGLGYAIYVAAFDLDEDSEDEKPSHPEHLTELDVKEFVPRPSTTPFSSVANFQGINSLPLNLSELSLASSQPFSLTLNRQTSNDVRQEHTFILGLNRQDSNAAKSEHTFTLGLSRNNSHINKSEHLFTLGMSRQNSNAATSDIGMPISDSPASSRARTSSHQSYIHQTDVLISPLLTDMKSLSPLITDESIVVDDEVDLVEVDKVSLRDSEITKASVKAIKSSPIIKSSPAPAMLFMPPTWEPNDSFSFPIAEIPMKVLVPDNLTMEHFSDIKHFADGSNANIYSAKLEGEVVIIKMMKEESQFDSIAVHEFEVEHGVLVRLSHPNIIKLLGAGRQPRRFIVLENLGGGTLNNILSQNQSKPGFGRLFRRPTFTYANLLSKLRDLSSAFDYLHQKVHPFASIIHRDLKPDNVGFASDGSLKLFDFGLCTIVRKRISDNETYEMTGNTGSLRYMAPEVALRKPYNEKVDVYSFGIMAWQMAKDKLPFKGMDKDAFMTSVVKGNERPPIDKSWPTGFTNLLTICWHNDPNNRPSFSQINLELSRLIDDNDSKIGKRSSASVFTPRGTTVANNASHWF